MNKNDIEAFEQLYKAYAHKRAELDRIFPELSQRNKPFTKPGRILLRRNTKSKYVILMDRQLKVYRMANITLGYMFKNTIPMCGRDDSDFITCAEFKTLCASNHTEYTHESRSEDDV